ncbi:MAG: tetratricopeptide repeat protein [candidate division WOR-3 bacterium]
MNSFVFSYFLCQQLLIVDDSLLFYEAYTAYTNYDFEEAESLLIQHNKLFPSSIHNHNALYLLGEINFKKQNYEKAIDFWQQLNTIHPNSEFKVSALKGIAEAYLAQQKYNSALKVYQKIENLELPLELMLEIKLRVNEINYHLGKYPKLIDALQNFVDTYADSIKSDRIVAQTMLRIAQLHTENKEYYAALTMLYRLEITYPESPLLSDVLFQEIKIYKIIGDVQNYKKKLYSIVLNKNLQNLYPYALMELGNQYRDEERYDSSLYFWTRLNDCDAYKDLALKEIAGIYYKIGFIDEALVVLQTLIKDFPDSKFVKDAYLLWIEILKKQGDLQKAKDILGGLIKKQPHQPEILVELGNISFGLKEYSRALKCYLQASEEFGDRRDESAKALILAGDVALVMGDTLSARRYYQNAGFIANSEEVKNSSKIKLLQIRPSK